MDISALESTISAFEKTQALVSAAVETVKNMGKGSTAVVKKKANEAIQEAKAKLELELEYTKQLIGLYKDLVPEDAKYEGMVVGITPLELAVTAADTQVKTQELTLKKLQKELSAKQQKAMETGTTPPSTDAVDKQKGTLAKAKESLRDAKDRLKNQQNLVAGQKQVVDDIKKQIEIVKIKMNPNYQPQSGATTTGSSEPTGVILTKEEIEGAREAGKERQQAKEEETKAKAPVFDKIDAEWMVVETGLAVLQNLATPLPQVATLPAAIGTAAPNPAFNMAAAGCVGILAAFVLADTKAAIIRWSTLCEEAGVEPTPDKIATITTITILGATIPTMATSGSVYVAPMMTNLL